MPTTFSAATCITSTFVSPGPFDIYLDSDYNSIPFSTVTKNQLTIGCPFIFSNIPTGTNNLGIKDINLDYCFTIDINDNNICLNCNIGLSLYSATTVSRLYGGILTGTCEPITSYYINWYGPNNSTTLALTTGFGPDFTNEWNVPHPFTGVGAIPLSEGVYTPIIQKIVIGGITYSNTGGTDTILTNLSNCLLTTTIEPLTCSNRTNTSTIYPQNLYSHNVNFVSESGVTPQPVNLTYVISSTTKFMAIAFNGVSNHDRLTLKFSGSSYGTTEIGLEDVLVGTDISSDFNPTLFPKSASTIFYYPKVICLTGLTVNNNDKILITVTPYNNITSWDLYMTCLSDYNCNDCLRTQPYKIIGSSITGKTLTCNQINIKYSVSACTSSSFKNSDYYTYYFFGQHYSFQQIGYTGVDNENPYDSNMYFNNVSCIFNGAPLSSSPTCQTDTIPTIYSKTFLTDGRGVFNITGSSNVISTYYNSWTSAVNGYSGSSNPLSISYYRHFRFNMPNLEKGNNCSDGESPVSVSVHPSSTITTGVTGTNYYFRLTANTITNALSYTDCDLSCNISVNGVVNRVNDNSTGNTINYGYTYTFPTGKYFSNPISYRDFVTSATTPSNNIEKYGFFRTYDWVSNTLPFSGVSTLLPSFSGTVCNYNNQGYKSPLYNSYYNVIYKYYYKTVLTNPSNINDFDILASPITNFVYSGYPSSVPNYELAYRYSGGNVTYSSSTYII
jgi:hypothetical protein